MVKYIQFRASGHWHTRIYSASQLHQPGGKFAPRPLDNPFLQVAPEALAATVAMAKDLQGRAPRL